LPAGFNGSATFESVNGTTPLAGAVAIYNSNGAQLLSFNTFKQGAAKVFLPRVSKNLSGQGYTAGWACQNLGPGVANMTMQVSMLNQGNGQTVNATLTRNGVASEPVVAGATSAAPPAMLGLTQSLVASAAQW
jgi:hypothetical protein